jgi:hypothetical protein
MEISELKTIIEKSGLSVYRIEKDLKIPNGTLNQVIKGTKKLPEKYEEPLRGLVALDLDKVEKIATGEEQGTISDAIVPAKLTIEEVPELTIKVKDSTVPPDGEQWVLQTGIKYIPATSDSYKGANVTIEEVPEPEEFNSYIKEGDTITFETDGTVKHVKRPDMSIADLL